MRRTRTGISINALIALAALALPSAGWAQGCVLCYTSLANGGPGAMRAFQMGILALLVPALLLCIAVATFIYSRACLASGIKPFYSGLFRKALAQLRSRRVSAPKRLAHRVSDAI